MISTLVRLPGFLLGMFAMYWSLQVGGLLYRVKFLSRKGRNDMYDWGSVLTDFFRLKLYRCGDKKLHKGPRCLYLCNHRSWCDFFLDMVLAEGRASVLSRGMVFVVFTLGCLFAWCGNYIQFFNRSAVKDHEKFNQWLEDMLKQGPLPGIVVYPEGHRNLKSTPLPLRRGILKFGYSRKIPCQIIMTKNKESVICEKNLTIGFGKKLVVGYSDVIDPAEFDDFEIFAKKVQIVWDNMWATVHAAEISELPPLEFNELSTYEVPSRNFFALAASMVLGMVSFFATLYIMSSTAYGILGFFFRFVGLL
ncbi:hypothetical protein BSKO_00390 [Bryopsis sp. KO-2023]|nr:hypothetical protein BSKO_00390 [Bryopsis sp. KO-2023]